MRITSGGVLTSRRSCRPPGAGGKTVTAQVFLVMMARANPVISILKRGNSYRSLVELMGAGSLKWTLKVRLVSRPGFRV
jgi:hypothetical protein